MKNCFLFLIIVFICPFYWNCSNEIDVLAPYQENALVYGLLDPNKDTQFIKINKVFINPNSKVSDVAKNADSLYFDSIKPILVEIETGRIITLHRANLLFKEDGYFATQPNYLYTTTERIFSKHPTQPIDYNYRVEFELPNSKKIISAVTNIPDAFGTQQSKPVNRVVFPFTIDFPDSSRQFKNTNVTLLTSKKSKLIDAYYIFRYIEMDKSDTNIKTNKYIKLTMINNYRTSSDRVQENVNVLYRGQTFYDQLLRLIEKNPNKLRRVSLGEFVLISGNLELDNYVESTKPSIGIVQKQSEYTNVVNGIGIFASRRTVITPFVDLGITTKNNLKNLDYIKSLNFID